MIVQSYVEMEFKQEQEHAQIPNHNMVGNHVKERLQRIKLANSKNVQLMATGASGQSLEIVQRNVEMEFKQEQEHAQILNHNMVENHVKERPPRIKPANS